MSKQTSADKKISLTQWEAEQAAFMMEFCLSKGYCLGMDCGTAEDGNPTKLYTRIDNLVKRIEGELK